MAPKRKVKLLNSINGGKPLRIKPQNIEKLQAEPSVFSRCYNFFSDLINCRLGNNPPPKPILILPGLNAANAGNDPAAAVAQQHHEKVNVDADGGNANAGKAADVPVAANDNAAAVVANVAAPKKKSKEKSKIKSASKTAAISSAANAEPADEQKPGGEDNSHASAAATAQPFQAFGDTFTLQRPVTDSQKRRKRRMNRDDSSPTAQAESAPTATAGDSSAVAPPLPPHSAPPVDGPIASSWSAMPGEPASPDQPLAQLNHAASDAAITTSTPAPSMPAPPAPPPLTSPAATSSFLAPPPLSRARSGEEQIATVAAEINPLQDLADRVANCEEQNARAFLKRAKELHQTDFTTASATYSMAKNFFGRDHKKYAAELNEINAALAQPPPQLFTGTTSRINKQLRHSGGVKPPFANPHMHRLNVSAASFVPPPLNDNKRHEAAAWPISSAAAGPSTNPAHQQRVWSYNPDGSRRTYCPFPGISNLLVLNLARARSGGSTGTPTAAASPNAAAGVIARSTALNVLSSPGVSPGPTPKAVHEIRP